MLPVKPKFNKSPEGKIVKKPYPLRITPVKVLLSQEQIALKFKRGHLEQFRLHHQIELEKLFNLLMNIIKIKFGNVKICLFL